jgi:hypothetical protein
MDHPAPAFRAASLNGISTTDISVALFAVAGVILIVLLIVLVAKILADRLVPVEPPTVIIYSNTPKLSAMGNAEFPTDMHVDVIYLENPVLKQQQYMHRTLNTTSASPSPSSPTSSAPISPFRDSSSPVSESKKNE